MNSVLEHAARYVSLGLSVAPVRRDGSKAASEGWKAYQSELASPDRLKSWFARDEYGVAIIAGAVSGNLEVVDIDAPELLDAIWKKLLAEVPALKT